MNNSYLLLPIAAVVAVAPAAQAGSVDAAEHVRLTEEMRRLAKRNAWKGVEAAFVKLKELEERGVELSYEDYYLGAQAARALGDINAVYKRLKAAAKEEGSKEVIEWLSDLDGTYGQVALVSKRKKGVELKAVQMPFAPDQRAAIEVAMSRIAEHGRYKGLLPQGKYHFGDELLNVVAGGEVLNLVLVDERPPKEEREPFKLAYIGPRFSIGPAFISAGEPGEVNWSTERFQPHGFGGAGARAGVGLEAGLGKKLGAMVEVGYHGGFGKSLSSDDDASQLTSSVGEPYELKTRSVNMGYGWLGLTGRFGRVWALGGPIWSVGSAYTADIPNSGDKADEAASCTDCVVSARGTIMAPGAALGVSYALAEIGNFNGALSLHGGGQHDGSRLYSWVQLAFTLAPASSRSD